MKEELIERLETGVSTTGRPALSNLSINDGDRSNKRPVKKERKLQNQSGKDQENISEGANGSMPNEVDGGNDGKPDHIQVKKRKLFGEQNSSCNSYYHSESFMQEGM